MAEQLIAVDTNIVVTLLARPDDPFFAAVDALFSEEFVTMPATVLLESEWVLRAVYGWSKPDAMGGLARLLSLPNVETEASVGKAVEWSLAGLDFADALHLAGASEARAFVTCDRKLVRDARGLDGAPFVETPDQTQV